MICRCLWKVATLLRLHTTTRLDLHVAHCARNAEVLTCRPVRSFAQLSVQLDGVDLQMTEDDRLKGWKEIAACLRTSERTAQRWENQLGLPVQRLETTKGAIVFASRGELEAWLASARQLPALDENHRTPLGDANNSTPVRPQFAHTTSAAVGIGVVMLIVLLAGVWRVWAPGHSNAATPASGPSRSGSINTVPQPAGSSLLPQPVPLSLTRDGKRSTVTVPAGGMGRITIGGHVTLGLSPVVNHGGIDLDVFRIEGVAPTGGEQLTKLTTFRLEPGTTVKLEQTFGTLEIAWLPKRIPPL